MELFSKSLWYASGAILILACVAMAILMLWSVKSYQESLPMNALEADLQLEMQAVRELHSRLDDDKDGQVDSEESEEFVREELSSNSTDKSKTFHKEETLVSSDELWNKWVTSKAHNWSCDEMVTWLVRVVELPELAPVFRERYITGRFLPLIAINTSHFLVGLETSKRQRVKLQIKAMDVVLFGVPVSSESYWKDTVVVMSLALCVMGLVYAWRKQRLARTKIDHFLEEIRDYESELKTLRERLSLRRTSSNITNSTSKETTPPVTPRSNSTVSETIDGPSTKKLETSRSYEMMSPNPHPIGEVRTRSFSLNPHLAEEVRTHSFSLDDAQENVNLKQKIWTLESQLETVLSDRIVLKSLLQEACYSEWSHLESLRKKAEEEVLKAQKVCDKIKRKRSSVIGAFRLANSSTLEDAGLQITRAVNRMQRIAERFHDYHDRWKKIEQVSHLSLTISSHASSSSSSLTNLTTFSTTDSVRGGRTAGLLGSVTSVLNNGTIISASGLPEEGANGANGLDINSCQENKAQSSSSSSKLQTSNSSSRSVELTNTAEREQVCVAFGIGSDVRRWTVGSSNETLDIIQEEEGSNASEGSRDIEGMLTECGEVVGKKHSRLNGLKKSRKLKHS